MWEGETLYFNSRKERRSTDAERFTDLVARKFPPDGSPSLVSKKDEARSSTDSNRGWIIESVRTREERMKSS